MIKQLKFELEAREAILKGAEIVGKAVGATLGPRGANVSIERSYGIPYIIHDGVKVAAQIAGENTFIEDQWQNTGAKHVYQATKDTNDIAGDGTTTAAILTYAILSEGHKLVVAGHNSRMLRRGILAAIDKVNQELDILAKPVKTQKEKEQVATISAQDEKIGQAIASAVKIVGDEGVITVDEIGQDLSIDYKEGMQFDQGLIDPLWINDPMRMECVLENPAVLVTDYTINDITHIESLLEEVVGNRKEANVLIIAKEIAGSALIYLAQNSAPSVNGNVNTLRLLPIPAPKKGDDQSERLRDIATLVGARFISEKAGDLLSEVEPEDLGRADKVTAGQKSTIIAGGKGAKEDIDLRISHINDQLKRPDVDEYHKEQLRERKSKLTNGIAVIHVGNDPERREQVIDAISATKAAIAEGIVPGGETAYLQARDKIADLKIDLTEEEYFGAEIVYRALEAPFRKLIENSGEEAGAILDKVVTSKLGYDVQKRQLVDLLKEGIIDPVKVSKTALSNAGKTATALLTTDVLITIMRRKDDTQPNNG